MKLDLSDEEARALVWALSRLGATSIERRVILDGIVKELEIAGFRAPPKQPHLCRECRRPSLHMVCNACARAAFSSSTKARARRYP